MSEQIKILGIILLLVSSIVLIQHPVSGEAGQTIYVDDDNTSGPWDGTLQHPYQHIQDGINNAGSSCTVFVKSGMYYEHVIVNKTIHLIGQDKDTTIIDGSNIGDVVYVSADDTSIENFTIQNAGSGWMPDFDAGIELLSDDTVITHNIIDETKYSIYIQSPSSHNSITGNVINHSRYGIYLWQSSYNTITNNVIKAYQSDYHSYAIYLRDQSQNNVISENNITVTDDGEAISLNTGCNNNTIIKNVIRSSKIDSVWDFKGIKIVDSSYNMIANNTIMRTFSIIIPYGDQTGIVLEQSSNNIILQNVITDLFKSIFCEASSNTIISENILSHASDNCALTVSYSYGNTISSNSIDDSGSGILLAGVTNANITNNTITDCVNGISVQQSAFNTFSKNTVSDCMYGIALFDVSTDNVIFYNNFITNTENVLNNTQQGYAACDNTWDNDDLSGGNYWSDYYGIDANNDGIGDTPYPIPGSTKQDRYPFMIRDGWTKRLQISAPNQVNENTQFQVTITANNIPINHVMLNFSGGLFYTDTQGKATLTAPEVTQNTNKQITAYKEGYYNDSVSITILDSTSPVPATQLVINAPSSSKEGNHFRITVTANNIPINQVKIVFDNTEYYTNTEGVLDLMAPLVDHDSAYSLVASKTGYLSAETWISILNNKSIQLISPNGGESWNSNQTIEWRITFPEPLLHYAVTIQYQYAFGLWVPLANIRKNITAPYELDTRIMADGYPYLIKVSLRKDNDHDGIYEILVDEDTSDAPFAIDNSNTHEGWIQGYINETIHNVTIPLKGVSVYVILSNVDNVITSKCTLTNESGFYQLPIRTGVYTVVATKTGYNTTAIHNLSVWVNETTEVNFTMTRGIAETNLFLFTELREDINHAIQHRLVGGEISILKKKDESGYENYVFMYDSINIIPAEVTEGYIVLQISGEQIMLGGKTLIINLDQHILDITKETKLRYDGEPLQRTTDFPDILNPNDDGFHAEYYLKQDSQGSFLAISIPHFSDHTIIIQTLKQVSKGLSVGIALLLFVSFFIILGIFYFIPYFYVRARKNK